MEVVQKAEELLQCWQTGAETAVLQALAGMKPINAAAVALDVAARMYDSGDFTMWMEFVDRVRATAQRG
jgi:hypothetical protein